MNNQKNAEIVYPHEWEFRIFALDEFYNSVRNESVIVFDSLGLEFFFRDGNTSASGKYKVFVIETTVPDKLTVDKAHAALASIQGVKMVM